MKFGENTLKRKATIPLKSSGLPRYGRVVGHNQQIEQIPRNTPCPCGSGQKFKKCCITK